MASYRKTIEDALKALSSSGKLTKGQLKTTDQEIDVAGTKVAPKNGSLVFGLLNKMQEEDFAYKAEIINVCTSDGFGKICSLNAKNQKCDALAVIFVGQTSSVDNCLVGDTDSTHNVCVVTRTNDNAQGFVDNIDTIDACTVGAVSKWYNSSGDVV